MNVEEVWKCIRPIRWSAIPATNVFKNDERRGWGSTRNVCNRWCTILRRVEYKNESSTSLHPVTCTWSNGLTRHGCAQDVADLINHRIKLLDLDDLQLLHYVQSEPFDWPDTFPREFIHILFIFVSDWFEYCISLPLFSDYSIQVLPLRYLVSYSDRQESSPCRMLSHQIELYFKFMNSETFICSQCVMLFSSEDEY